MKNSLEPNSSGLRERAGRWVESKSISYFIMFVIIANAITLGMQTSKQLTMQYGEILDLIDNIALVIFCIELSIKLFAYGWRFFLNAWNIFDFLVVSISLVPSSGNLSILRILRILRVLRLISMLPQLRIVVEALLKAIPGIISIAGLLSIVYYVFAVIATSMFGEKFPEWFGSLGASLYTLFQIMTLESWSMGISRPVMETYPNAWAFFVPFILVSTFTMLNLFIAVIVNSIQSVQESIAAEKGESTSDVVTELHELRQELKALKLFLENQHSKENIKHSDP